MKRVTVLLISLIFVLSACNGSTINDATSNDNKISIYTTIFPIYDWAKVITKGDGVSDITLLTDSGVDMHNYQPTVEDIINISECDLLIYVGGESEEWIEDVVDKAKNPPRTISLLEVLGENALTEQVVEGMDTNEEESDEYDEHIWLSLANASIFADVICQSLCELNTDNSSLYQENLESYKDEISLLDKEYKSTLSNAKNDTLIFADRFPFRYLVDEYGLNYYAAFLGCMSESEASFETVRFLSQKAYELEVPSILIIDGSDKRIANTIMDTSKRDLNLLSLNSMQSVTKDDIASGLTYLSCMKDNLDIIKHALEIE